MILTYVFTQQQVMTITQRVTRVPAVTNFVGQGTASVLQLPDKESSLNVLRELWLSDGDVGSQGDRDLGRWLKGELFLKHAADIRDSHGRTPRNSRPTRFCVISLPVPAQSRLSVERPRVTCVARIGPVPFCAACGSVPANYGSDNNRRGLLTK